jgi:hypothetical protein
MLTSGLDLIPDKYLNSAALEGFSPVLDVWWPCRNSLLHASFNWPHPWQHVAFTTYAQPLILRTSHSRSPRSWRRIAGAYSRGR